MPIDRTRTDLSSTDHEALVRILEKGIRVRDLGKIISLFKVQTVCASVATVVTFLVAIFSVGYNTYPWWNKETITPIERIKPRYVNMKEIVLAEPAQERYSFLVPTVDFLEDEAQAAVSMGEWKDSLVVLATTEPFEHPTMQFSLRIDPAPGHNVSGFAYRLYGSAEHRQYQPLMVTRANQPDDRSSHVSVVECDRADRLLLVLRISSEAAIPQHESSLRKTVQLHVE